MPWIFLQRFWNGRHFTLVLSTNETLAKLVCSSFSGKVFMIWGNQSDEKLWSSIGLVLGGFRTSPSSALSWQSHNYKSWCTIKHYVSVLYLALIDYCCIGNYKKLEIGHCLCCGDKLPQEQPSGWCPCLTQRDLNFATKGLNISKSCHRRTKMAALLNWWQFQSRLSWYFS